MKEEGEEGEGLGQIELPRKKLPSKIPALLGLKHWIEEKALRRFEVYSTVITLIFFDT